jgi:hypothetical protein
MGSEYRVAGTESRVKKFWQFTLVGLVEGVVLGWLLSLGSGNIFITIMIGTLGRSLE